MGCQARLLGAGPSQLYHFSAPWQRVGNVKRGANVQEKQQERQVLFALGPKGSRVSFFIFFLFSPGK